MLGSLLCLLTGTMLGMLIRSSAGALVAYFVYAPPPHRSPGSWPPARTASWTCSPWVDPNFARSFLFEGPPHG